MLRDALEFFDDRIRAAIAPVRVEARDEDNDHFVIGGEIRAYPRSAPSRGHKVGTLDDLVEYANGAPDPASVVVWFDDSAVVAILDDDGQRRHRVRLSLQPTEQFHAVAGLASVPAMDHRSFVRFLRTRLAGIEAITTLLPKLKKLDFEATSRAESRISRGEESMGSDLRAAVRGEVELPETLIVGVPVFRRLPYRAAIPCTLDTDPVEKTIRLVPMPDAVDEARDTAVSAIGVDLHERLSEGIRSFWGAP